MSTTSKRALLIGCNYSGANQLYGCINDIIQLKGLLIDVYGFAPSEIVTLRDDDPSNMPRKARIVQELQALVAANPANTVIAFSGHGTQVADTSGEEVDGKDEVIVPCDYQLIKDDELNAILKPYKGSGLAIFDCCHSGTILDLSFNGVNATSTARSANGLLCFSGCQDNDYSAETFSEVAGLPQGAMTAGLIAVLRRLKYFPAADALWTELKKELRGNGFTQIPQLSASVEVTRTTPFPLVNPAAGVAAELATLRAQVASLQQQLLQQQTAAAAAAAAAATATTTSSTAAATELAALRAQVASLKQQQTAATAQIAALQKDNATLNAAATAATATATAQIATLQKENATLKTANARIPGLETQIRTLQVQAAQVPVLQRQVRDQQTLLAQIPTLKAQLATLQAQLAAAQRQLAAKK
jgi:hypothetical protein